MVGLTPVTVENGPKVVVVRKIGSGVSPGTFRTVQRLVLGGHRGGRGSQ